MFNGVFNISGRLKSFSKCQNAGDWVELLADEELPAITSMAAVLDKFEDDDVSSIPKLSKVVLHDQALSSSVLKVANGAIRSQRKKVKTVSRAAIVLGIQTIKNICLTAKILDRLLKNQNVPLAVYDRLMMLMANGFYAGHLARSMVPDHNEAMQEEIYLAAMMQHIGETAFWCTGTDLTEQLIEKANLAEDDFQRHCASVLGVRFKDLSIGLCKRWNLGELVSKSLEQPEKRTLEANVVSLANQLAAITNNSAVDKDKYQKLVSNISNLVGVSIPVLKRQIEETRLYAMELLNSYGASVLNSYINPLPSEFNDAQQQTTPTLSLDVTKKAPEKTLIETIKSLTQLTKDGSRINDFLVCTLRSMGSVVNFELSSFWALSKDRRKVESRVTFNNHGNVLRLQRSIQVKPELNLFSYAIENPQPVMINYDSRQNWEDLITREIEELLKQGPICIAAVCVGEKTIGLLVTQQSGKQKIIDDDEFSNFCLIADHLNLCLGMLPKR